MSDDPPRTDDPPQGATAVHGSELRRFVAAMALLAVFVGIPYLHPSMAAVRIWLPGEPIPMVRVFVERITEARAKFAAWLGMQSPVEEAAPVAQAEIAEDAAYQLAPLPEREHGVPTRIEDTSGTSLDHFFSALQAVEEEQGIARISYFGDSTVALDGITRTVRDRLRERFGDAGPGFAAIGCNTNWVHRYDMTNMRLGDDWDSSNSTFGGELRGRYGLGGVVSTTTGEATVVLGGQEIDGQKQKINHVEVYYQAGEEHGPFWVYADGEHIDTVAGNANFMVDLFWSHDFHPGVEQVAVVVPKDQGPVTFYGAELETDGPGITLDLLANKGNSFGSVGQFGKGHLHEQVAHRQPDLIVVAWGGNTLPTSKNSDEGYIRWIRGAVQELRVGRPEASCMFVAPLDQGRMRRGKIESKPEILRVNELERLAAEQEGCAFWSAFDAMGGEGSMGRWQETRPQLGWTDYTHLTEHGHQLMGDLMADAMLAAYDDWLATGGPERAAEAEAKRAAEAEEERAAEAEAERQRIEAEEARVDEEEAPPHAAPQ